MHHPPHSLQMPTAGSDRVGAITRFEGFVARYLGGGVLAYFGYPVALEAEIWAFVVKDQVIV
jgi:hypothetical protein